MNNKKLSLLWIILFSTFTSALQAQHAANGHNLLSAKQKSLIAIAAVAAKGDLPKLAAALHSALDAGLSINEGKEALVHLYAYAGFPRSIRGLQTFMHVLDERKEKGIRDSVGATASPIDQKEEKYHRGKRVLEELTGAAENGRSIGYGAFAPAIDVFLKEHLFADIFERDVLSYAERELVTVSVLSSLGGLEPMLASHLKICFNVGLNAEQLQQFVEEIRNNIGEQEADAARQALDVILAEQMPSQ